MSLTLYFHPLASFCHKVLVALYENDTPFTPHFVDLMDEAQNAAFKKLWPVGKFPVLRDDTRNRTIPESTTIIEYLARHYPGPSKLIPENAEAAFETRALDRFYDLHVHEPMQKIIVDRLRPESRGDKLGVEQARETLNAALSIVEKDMARKTWAAGEAFSMADCAAAPPLFYINMAVAPLAGRFGNLATYLERLMKRPSYARALKDAEPYFQYVPR
ncbi:MAG TPA: glutathione S-transferase family protein [Pseudolabrys sp.]|nr:glutathione S-transferase family protein [Pseudolabrys sp.]